MLGKKKFMAKILFNSQLLPIINYFGSNKLIVFNYHRFYNGAQSTQFDDGVFGQSLNEFENNVKWLLNNTIILTEDDLIEIITNRKTASKLCSLITFDDGYIDNYTLAYPVLKKLNVPAIFYIPTGQINSRQLGWWDIIAYIIKNTSKTSIKYNDEVIEMESRKSAIRLFQKIIKTRPHTETADLIIKLSETCNVALPEIQTQSNELMTWDQIREVSDNGISIGSHTHSHRVLSTIPIDEQRDELTISKSIIENEIGRHVRTIAYPVGGYQHFTSDTMKIAAECGYMAGFSFNTGVNYLDELSPYDIKRIEPSKENELLAATAAIPAFFT